MLQLNKLKIVSLAVFCCLTSVVVAQSTSNNPFSMYGFGEVDPSDYGRSSGMGGAGIATNFANTLNLSNPSSLTAIDSMRMIFDFSTAGRYSTYSTNTATLNSTNFNYKRLALTFRCMPGWGSSFGLAPYSNVGYNITSDQSIEGTESTTAVEYVGKGGINKLFWSNAFALGKHLSIGVNSSLLFGSVAQTQTISNWTIDKNAHVSKIYFDFGMQFHHALSENYQIGLGAIYGYKTKLNMQNDLSISNSSGVFSSETNTVKQYLPEFYGAGLSITRAEVLTLAADYKFTGWSALNTRSTSISYADIHKLAVGLDYSPNRRVARSYFERIGFQLGTSVSNSLLKKGGTNPLNIGYSCGIQFPFPNGSRMNIAYEYGNVGGKNDGLLLEKYHQVTINLSLVEAWFMRRRID